MAGAPLESPEGDARADNLRHWDLENDPNGNVQHIPETA